MGHIKKYIQQRINQKNPIVSQVMLCDNLSLPFRDESLDAVLSVAVIHHVATAERRVRALRELARVVRVGGRVMISVWAMEQRHRKVNFLSKNNMLSFFSF
jgi:ubiquinone/menaquinone biosynthesis C-methylase UbiE